MDTKHPKVAGNELARTSKDQPGRTTIPVKGIHGAQMIVNKTTPKQLKDLYLTILDRFAEEETKGVGEYEQLLDKVNQSITAAAQAGNAQEVAIPLIQMRRQINRILQEERTHLDAINVLKEMLQAK